jgi:hypothetical protein
VPVRRVTHVQQHPRFAVPTVVDAFEKMVHETLLQLDALRRIEPLLVTSAVHL